MCTLSASHIDLAGQFAPQISFDIFFQICNSASSMFISVSELSAPRMGTEIVRSLPSMLVNDLSVVLRPVMTTIWKTKHYLTFFLQLDKPNCMSLTEFKWIFRSFLWTLYWHFVDIILNQKGFWVKKLIVGTLSERLHVQLRIEKISSNYKLQI